MTSSSELWILFDFREPKAGCHMRRLAYDFKSRTTLERLGPHHAVMIVRPGGAEELERPDKANGKRGDR